MDVTEKSHTFGDSKSFLYWGREESAERHNSERHNSYVSLTQELIWIMDVGQQNCQILSPGNLSSSGEWDLQPPYDADSFHLLWNCGLSTLLLRERLLTGGAEGQWQITSNQSAPGPHFDLWLEEELRGY